MAALVADAGVPVGAHALARAQPGDVRRGPLRRRGHRGLRRAHRPGGGRRRRRGRPRASWSSTPGSASPRTPSTTGRCWPAWTGWSAWACRCWSGASRKTFLGRLLADADGAPRPGRASGTPPRWPPPCWPPRPGRGACGCTTPAASVDAVRTVAAVRAAREHARRPERPVPDRIAVRGLTRPRPPRRLRRRARAGADLPRRRRARGRHRARGRRRRPGADGRLRRAGPAAARGAHRRAGRPAGDPRASGWPTSAWPTRWWTPSQITVHKPEADLGVPVRRRHRHDPARAADDAGGALARAPTWATGPAPCAPR